MRRPAVLVWDLPVRLFHWLTALLFAVSMAIATLGDESGPLFPLHALLGVALLFVVAGRLLWAFIGSRTARLASFDFRPSALAAYLRGMVGSAHPPARREHTPPTSWYAAAALVVICGLGATGVVLGRGDETVESLHEALAFTMLALAALHVAGVFAHVLRTRENIVRAMVTGRTDDVSAVPIASSRRRMAAVFAVLIGGWAAALWSAYDPLRRAVALGREVLLVIGHAEGR